MSLPIQLRQGWKGEIQYPVYRQWVVRLSFQPHTVTAGKARVVLSLPLCVALS